MKADHTQVTRLLKTARGQIDGILKMIEEDRYCLDVSHQLMATQSILKKANRMVLKAHMDCCVREAVESGSPEEKLNELAVLLDQLADYGDRGGSGIAAPTPVFCRLPYAKRPGMVFHPGPLFHWGSSSYQASYIFCSRSRCS